MDTRDESRTEERLRLALEAGQLGAWEWGIGQETVFWDATLEIMHGLEPGSFSGTLEEYGSRIHPQDREEVFGAVEEARATASGYEVEHRIVRADGTVRWTHCWAKPRLDDGGCVVGYIGVVADVTDRRAAAHALAVVAETLQRSLLPPVPPEIPGVEIGARYHPALDGLAVGGDFYDVPRLGRRTWGIVVGDVCGKGAAAAAVTALVRYSLRSAAVHTTSPASVLRHVNGVLLRDQADATDPRYATALFGLLRPRPGGVDISFALGGHPKPFVVRRDGSVEIAGRPGTLLGVLTETRFFTTKVTLGPG